MSKNAKSRRGLKKRVADLEARVRELEAGIEGEKPKRTRGRKREGSKPRRPGRRPTGGPRRRSRTSRRPEPVEGRLILRTDGGARGNPGPSAAGVVIETADGKVIARMGRVLGRGTNNEAEYRAVIIALEEAVRLGAREVEVVTDSQLLARQLLGEYRVKALNLRPLYERACELLSAFDRWKVTDVRRESNRAADSLANRALDARADVDG